MITVYNQSSDVRIRILRKYITVENDEDEEKSNPIIARLKDLILNKLNQHKAKDDHAPIAVQQNNNNINDNNNQLNIGQPQERPPSSTEKLARLWNKLIKHYGSTDRVFVYKQDYIIINKVNYQQKNIYINLNYY